ncbi:MAG TPA: hypothetical protein VMO26_20785 [Vicinamibacterales bacterium]|nr:hypothetical protein [Vicinamibacterales bacterium]
MSRSTVISVNPSLPIHRNRVGLIALRGLQICGSPALPGLLLLGLLVVVGTRRDRLSGVLSTVR